MIKFSSPTTVRMGSLGIVLLVLTACGCAGPSGPHARNPEYGDGFYNASDQDLTGVHITWEADRVPYRVGAGLLGRDPNGTGVVCHYAPDPIPPRVTVHWKTADGAAHQAEAKVARTVPDPAHFTGTIYFRFTNAGVQVIPLSYAEIEREAATGITPMLTKRAAAAETYPATRASQ